MLFIIMKKFLLTLSLLLVAVTVTWCGWSNEDFVATTQSVKTPIEKELLEETKKTTDCSVSVYPSNTIEILQPFEISIDPVISWNSFEVIITEKNPQWVKKGQTSFTSTPITIERTILEAGTYTISYLLESDNWEKAQCDTTIVVN